jgi:hypothetical protein
MFYQERESPRIIQRKCGGWLAVSAPHEDLRIGVTAESEDAVRDKYQAAVTDWRRNLSAA